MPQVRTLAATMLALFTAASVSFAQDAPPPAVPAAAEPSFEGVEEIFVTITKRTESVQDVGGTIAAFGEEVIKNANIENVGDLIGLLPNVTVKSEDTDVSIRGVARAAFDSQSPVAQHVNGVYHYNSIDYIGQFYDLENVQVALGPSGSVYGRNANGGAIDITWRKPHGEFEVLGDTTWAPEFDNYQFRTAVNIPLSGRGNDLLNARFVLMREVQDGNLNNRQDTHRNSFGAKDDWSVRAFLRSQPSESLSLELRSRYFKGDRRYAGGVSLLPRGQVPVGVLPLGPSACGNCVFDWASGLVQFKNLLLTGSPNIWRLISRAESCMPAFPPNRPCTPIFPTQLAALEDILLNGRDLNGDPSFLEIPPLVYNPIFFTPVPAGEFDVGNRIADSRLHELGSGDLEIWDVDATVEWNLSGLPLFGDVDMFLLGGFGEINNEGLSESDATSYPALDTISGQNPEQRRTFELRFQSNNESWLNWTAGFFYLRNNIDQSRNTLTPLTLSGATLTQEEVGYSPFANVTLKPIDEIEIFLGARWNHDSFKRHEEANPTPLTPNPLPLDGRDTWRETTLDAGIKWFITEDHMVYAKWARGYKAGFIQLLPNPAGGATPEPEDDTITNNVDPETIIATEIGAKTSWFDGRVNANLAAFHYDYSKLQVPVIKVVQIVNVNADKSTVWGAELTLDVVPVDDWFTRVSIGWLQAEFDKFCADEPLSPVYGVNPVPVVDPACVGDPNGGLDLAGNRMEDSPEWKISVLTNYRWKLGSLGSLIPTLEFTWTDDAWRRPQNNSAVDVVHAYTKTDLRLRWEEPENRYWVEGFAENLENNYIYPRGIVVALTGTAQGFGLLQPRTYGVRLGFNWSSE